MRVCLYRVIIMAKKQSEAAAEVKPEGGNDLPAHS